MEGAPTQGFTGGQQSLFRGPTGLRSQMGGGEPTAAWSGPSAASFRRSAMPTDPNEMESLGQMGGFGQMGGSPYGEPAPMAPAPARPAPSFRGDAMPPVPAFLGNPDRMRMGGSSYGEPAPMAPPPPRRDPSLRGVSGAGPGGMSPGAMSAMGDAYGRDGASRQGRRSKMMELLRAYGQRNSGGGGGGGGGGGVTGLIAKMLMGGG